MRNKSVIREAFLNNKEFKITHTVYSLSHPITKDVFYVGVTQRELNKRLYYHMVASRLEAGSKKRHFFIRQLVADGHTPVIEPIENITSCTYEDYLSVFETEKYWTRQFKEWGFNLVNYQNIK